MPPRRRPIGMVFQSYALFPNMTIRQNVGFPLKVRGPGRRRDQAPGRRVAGAGRTRRPGGPLSASGLRRTAAAGGAGAGAGAVAGGAAARRTALGARRAGAHAAARRDPAHPAGGQDHRPLRHPRPGGGDGDRRPGGGDEQGPDRPDRGAAGTLRGAGDRFSAPVSSATATPWNFRSPMARLRLAIVSVSPRQPAQRRPPSPFSGRRMSKSPRMAAGNERPSRTSSFWGRQHVFISWSKTVASPREYTRISRVAGHCRLSQASQSGFQSTPPRFRFSQRIESCFGS